MKRSTKYKLTGKEVRSILGKVNIGFDRLPEKYNKDYNIVTWESYVDNTSDTHMISVRRNVNNEDTNVYTNNISKFAYNKLKNIDKVINIDN